ncbi:MAG: anion permease [Candidatus Sigynarchaeota archaeon]
MNVEVILTIILGLAFAFGIGASDETLATLVGSGGMRLRQATVVGAILATIGAIFLSQGVATSIGIEIVNHESFDLARYQSWILVSVLISVTTWLIMASRTGLPVSTTYSIIGAFVGVALCAPLLGTEFSKMLNWEKLQNIVIGWIASPLLGLAFTWIMGHLMKRFIRRRIRGLGGMEKLERTLMIALIFFSCFNQINRAGNDAGKALGIFYSLGAAAQIDGPTMVMMIIAGSVMVGSGLLIIGRHLLRNVGKNLIEIRPSDAICIETSMSIVLLLANLIALPISGGQVLVFAIIGLAMAKHESVNKKRLKRIVYSWLITFPLAAASSAGILALFFRGVTL